MASKAVENAMALLRGIARGDVDQAIGHVNPEGFIQHDPSVADGVAGLREQADGAAGDVHLEVVRLLQDGPFVVAHGLSGEEVFFAVFRFGDGLLAEHWRFTTPAAPPNESGHTQTDGPSAPDPGQDGDRAKAIVRDYYETVHIAGRHDQIGAYMSGSRQIRHEPGVQDGVAAFERDLAVLTRSRTIDEIVLLAGEGDLVFIAARGTHEKKPCAYIDLYRVEKDKLVEHWGFPQPIPSRNASRNGNALL